MMAGSAITWCSKKQTVVALSSCEAEYVAMCMTCKEAIWLKRLLSNTQVHTDLSKGMTVLADSQSGFKLSAIEAVNSRNKHLDITYHFVRQVTEDGQVKKLDAGGRPASFIGYAQASEAYKLIDLQNREVIVSRDLKFDEESSADFENDCTRNGVEFPTDVEVKDGDDRVRLDTEIEDLVDQDTDTEQDIASYQGPTEYENIGSWSNADVSDEPDQPKSATILRSGRVSKPPWQLVEVVCYYRES